jgi:hypothetical protein
MTPVHEKMPKLFDPWVGGKYKSGSGLLIISESAYCWEVDGLRECPKADHPTGNTVQHWALQNFEERGKEGRYPATVTRALCGKLSPTLEERTTAWDEVAYSIFVQTAMPDRHHRPCEEDFAEAQQPFLDLLEDLRPARVLVTGVTAWKNMPPTQLQSTNDLQAYRLRDGHLCWCRVARHPRILSWRDLSKQLSEFMNQDLGEPHES